MTSSIGVAPSMSQELSSRRTMSSSWKGLTRSPITVFITSCSDSRPTTSAYSLRMSAKSSLASRKRSSASKSVSVSGSISTLRTIGWVRKDRSWPCTMRGRMSFEST